MAAPWEKYAAQPAEEAGPWAKYQAPQEAQPSDETKGLLYNLQTPGRDAANWLQNKLPPSTGALDKMLNPQEQENSIQMGMIGGQGFGAAADEVGKVASKPVTGLLDKVSAIPEKLKSVSDSLALKGAGGMLKDFRTAIQKGRMGDLGDFIRENKLVRPGDSVDDVYGKASALRDKVGQKIGSIYKTVTGDLENHAAQSPEAAKQVAEVEAKKFHPFNDADTLKSMVEQNLAGAPQARPAINRLMSDIDEMAMKHLDSNDIPTTQKIIKDWDNVINYSKKTQDLPAYQQGAKMIRNFIREKTNSFVEGSDQILQSQKSKELLEANKAYQNVSDVYGMSGDKAAREGANRGVSLTDTIAAGAGYASKGLEGGALGYLLNKGVRKYGPGIGMTATDNLSGLLKRPAQAVGKVSEVIKKRPGLIGQPLLAPSKKTDRED